MHKKGFFFTLDAIIALSIVAVSMFIAITAVTSVPRSNQLHTQMENIEGILATTTIEELNSPYAGVNGVLWNQGHIDQRKNTLLQQLGEFSATKRYDVAYNFSVNVTEPLLPNQYHLTILADDEMIFPRNWTTSQERSYNTSLLVASRASVQYGLSNNTQLWGPITIQLILWEK